MHILVVEDEVVVALSMESTLLDGGHSIAGVAFSLKNALSALESAHPELALVDINLQKDRGGGIVLARHLLETRGIPSLFVSGQYLEARQNRDAALGYLSKPYDTRTLLASVEIARQIIHGEQPDTPPPGLELFNGTGSHLEQ